MDETEARKQIAQNLLTQGGDAAGVARSAAHAIWLRDERIKALEEQLDRRPRRMRTGDRDRW